MVKTMGIIGLGLMGGSLAKSIRTYHQEITLLGNDSAEGAEKLVDKLVDFDELCAKSDCIVLAVPVDAIVKLLPKVLDKISSEKIVFDLGSTKSEAISSVATHPLRRRYVAMHPMTGTENSGPSAAEDALFAGRFILMIDRFSSDSDAVEFVAELFLGFGARLEYMKAKEHDKMAAWLSHMPHVLSFALAETLKKESAVNGLDTQFAGGGLASMLRLSHSPASMWKPIFMQNSEPLIDALDAYMLHLAKFRDALAAGNADEIEAHLNES